MAVAPWWGATAAEAPYQRITGLGRNNLVDATALGACVDGVGCRSIDHSLCLAGAPCNLERVPAGRCSRGANLVCLWPNGAGDCALDANIGCIVDGDCPSGTCDTTLLDPGCACQGVDSSLPDYEAGAVIVCGATSQAVCSDGDPEAEFGSGRIGLCTLVDFVAEITFGCGAEAGEALSGPRFPVENPRLDFTPQRGVGGLGLDTAPITEVIETHATDFADPNSGTGVRRFVEQADSQWTDWSLRNKDLEDVGVSRNQKSSSCNTPPGWLPGSPFNPGSGACSVSGGSCSTHQDCCGGDACGTPNDAADLCTGLDYCHSIGFDGVGFVWTDPAFDPDDPNLPSTCPPKCGTTADFHTLEHEQLLDTYGMDRRAGVQLALDHLDLPLAGFGDAVAVRTVFHDWWLGEADRRCVIGGDPAALAGEVGRCSASAGSCNPDNFTPFIDCPPGETCARCSTSVNQAGLCSNDGSSCQVAGPASPDCGAAGTCNHPADLNLPGAFDDHGFASLSPIGRIGGLAISPPDVQFVTVLAWTTGDVAAEFRDNDSFTVNDSQTLGRTVGGGLGIGSGGTFSHGSPLPAFPGELCCATGSDITFLPESAGTPLGKLMRTYDWAPGSDIISGCIGDSSKTFDCPTCTPLSGACNDRLGDSGSPGNTGADDRILEASIGGCSLTCIGEPGLNRGHACGPGSALDPTPGPGNDSGDIAGSVCPDASSVCGCGGLDATSYSADLLPNPTDPFPTFRMLAAQSVRDLTSLTSADLDLIFKERDPTAPYVGSCSSDGSQCAQDSNCPSGGSCDNIQLTAAAPCDDDDGDGICNDGDGSGTAGDAPCSCASPGVPAGCEAGCDDNCRFRANSTQIDSGGVSSTQYVPGNGAADGIGDACQCGDMNGDGVVNTTDVVLYRRKFGGQPSPFSTDRCSVLGTDGVCNSTDVTIMRRTFAGLATSILDEGACPARLGIPDPMSP